MSNEKNTWTGYKCHSCGASGSRPGSVKFHRCPFCLSYDIEDIRPMKTSKLTKIPKLIPIDLSKSHENDHPDIKENAHYLARIQMVKNIKWYAGTFSKLWYGWNFNAVYDAGYQLDYGFLELYEIVETI